MVKKRVTENKNIRFVVMGNKSNYEYNMILILLYMHTCKCNYYPDGLTLHIRVNIFALGVSLHWPRLPIIK